MSLLFQSRERGTWHEDGDRIQTEQREKKFDSEDQIPVSGNAIVSGQ